MLLSSKWSFVKQRRWYDAGKFSGIWWSSFATTASSYDKIRDSCLIQVGRICWDWRSTFCFDDFSALIFSFFYLQHQKLKKKALAFSLSSRIHHAPLEFVLCFWKMFPIGRKQLILKTFTYYFLQLYGNLQLCPNKKFTFKKKQFLNSDNRSLNQVLALLSSGSCVIPQMPIHEVGPTSNFLRVGSAKALNKCVLKQTQ